MQEVIPDCVPMPDLNADINEIVLLRNKYHISSEDFCVLFMGGLSPIKGIDVLLKAADSLTDEHIKIIIAGHINFDILTLSYEISHFWHIKYIAFLHSVRTRLFRLLNQGKIVLTGYTNDMIPLIRLCNTVAFPSTAPHQPRPCIEAGAFRRSVILSDYDATREFFIDGYNALTFRPRDYKALSHVILRLKSNPDLNRQIADNNYYMTCSRHNYQSEKKRFISFFEKVFHE